MGAESVPLGHGMWHALQFVLLVALTTGASFLVLLHVRKSAPRRLAVAGALCFGGVVTLVGAGWSSARTIRIASQQDLVETIPATAAQHPGAEATYVGSAACQSCHPGEFDTWHDSYHRTMTQAATPEAVIGDFNDRTLTSRDQRYRFERVGDEFWVEMPDPDWAADMLAVGELPELAWEVQRTRRRVVMTTGSHHMQTYWVGSAHDGRLFNVPFVWLKDLERWVPREDVFMRPPTAPQFNGQWQNNCIECHAVAGEGNHTESSNAWSPSVAELGISCEACHGPASAHIEKYTNPVSRYAARQQDALDDTIVNPARLSAPASAQVCGQCHGMNLFKKEALDAGKRYHPGDDLFETRMALRIRNERLTPAEEAHWDRMQSFIATQGERYLGDRMWSDGMVRVSGRDHNGLIESACFEGGELSCLNCHSMHDYEAPANQMAHGGATNQPCLECHAAAEYDAPTHTHHAANSAGSQCTNCHMPHTVYGLMKGVRSHLIDSPNALVHQETGRPNACSLCHLDRPLGWVADQLSSWYGQERPNTLTTDNETVAVGPLMALTGDAGQRGLIAWHFGWEPAREASGGAWMDLYLASLLSDEYSAVRRIAERSLRQSPMFEDMTYDYVASPEEVTLARKQAMQQWIQGHGGHPLERSGPELLIGAQGQLNVKRLAELTRQRDNRPIDLRE